MLAFARETKLMETTFVQPADVAGADYRNRIWTVAEEVPFAGHPSLGTAVAVSLQRGEEDAVYHQQTLAGIQEVRVSRRGDRARASVLQERAETGPEVDPAAAMAAVGLRPDGRSPDAAAAARVDRAAGVDRPGRRPRSARPRPARRAGDRGARDGVVNFYLC